MDLRLLVPSSTSTFSVLRIGTTTNPPWLKKSYNFRLPGTPFCRAFQWHKGFSWIMNMANHLPDKQCLTTKELKLLKLVAIYNLVYPCSFTKQRLHDYRKHICTLIKLKSDLWRPKGFWTGIIKRVLLRFALWVWLCTLIFQDYLVTRWNAIPIKWLLAKCQVSWFGKYAQNYYRVILLINNLRNTWWT